MIVIHPRKLTWNPKIGLEDDFPFRMGDFFRFQPLVFRGVTCFVTSTKSESHQPTPPMLGNDILTPCPGAWKAELALFPHKITVSLEVVIILETSFHLCWKKS